MHKDSYFHVILSCLLTVAILAFTGVLGLHHPAESLVGQALAASRTETGPILAPDGTPGSWGSDPHCTLCAIQQLLNQSCVGPIHELPAPGRGPALVTDTSNHPTVPAHRSVGARSPPLS